jgi:TctA family transporter
LLSAGARAAEFSSLYEAKNYEAKNVQKLLNLKTAVAGPKTAHPAKITAAFEFPVLTLTVPGFRAENIKILCAFNQLHHFGPP